MFRRRFKRTNRVVDCGGLKHVCWTKFIFPPNIEPRDDVFKYVFGLKLHRTTLQSYKPTTRASSSADVVLSVGQTPVWRYFPSTLCLNGRVPFRNEYPGYTNQVHAYVAIFQKPSDNTRLTIYYYYFSFFISLHIRYNTICQCEKSSFWLITHAVFPVLGEIWDAKTHVTHQNGCFPCWQIVIFNALTIVTHVI